jgi:hypothetical protein
MLQNSPSPKCESRNPPQMICEFRKIHSPPIQFGCSRFQIDAIVLRPILYHGGELGIHSLDGRLSPCGQLHMVFHLLQRCQSPCERLLIMTLLEGLYSLDGRLSPCGRFWPQVRAGQTQHELSLHQCYRRNSSSKPTCLAHFRWPIPTKTTKFFGIPQSSVDSSPSMIDSKCPKTWQDSIEKACSRPASTATFKP